MQEWTCATLSLLLSAASWILCGLDVLLAQDGREDLACVDLEFIPGPRKHARAPFRSFRPAFYETQGF